MKKLYIFVTLLAAVLIVAGITDIIAKNSENKPKQISSSTPYNPSTPSTPSTISPSSAPSPWFSSSQTQQEDNGGNLQGGNVVSGVFVPGSGSNVDVPGNNNVINSQH